MTPDQIFLANAYLDGELDAAERAVAEADPAVMAEVEQLRVVQAGLRDVEPPSEQAREAAIAAAMSEFRASAAAATSVMSAPAPTRPVGRTNVVPFFRRPAARVLLGAAAAVVAVGLFGLVVTSGRGDDDLDTADAPAAEPAEAPADEPADEPAEEPAEEPVMEDSGDVAQAEVMADDAAGEPAEEPAEEPASEPVVALDPATARAIADAIAAGEPFSTPEELAAFAGLLLEQEAAGELPPTPNHACPVEGVLARATYAGGPEPADVLVMIDREGGFVAAILEDDCTPVLEAPLP